MRILAIIPARGGSKGIPRKNVRLLKNKPLIGYSIECAKKSKYKLDCIVSTDDSEIEYISKKFGATVIKRPDYLATDEVTLDPVINHAVNFYEKLRNEKYDIVITIQPTSPLLSSQTLDDAIKCFIENDYDTLLSVTNHPHLSWGRDEQNNIIPLYKERKNRQYLPDHFIETGAFVITKRKFITENNRFGKNISVYEIPKNESIDIDTPQDWWIAERELSKKKIVFRVEGYSEIGLGHIYRTLLLAYNLIEHTVEFILSSKSDLGIRKIQESFFPYKIIDSDEEFIDYVKKEKVDIVIHDILNTDIDYMKSIKETGIKIINFEDLGPGSQYADILINDLYEKQETVKNQYWGKDYFCLRDEFLLTPPSAFNEKVKEVLIIFGGTDPNNLTLKAFKAIDDINGFPEINYTFILGLGYKNKDQFLEIVKKGTSKKIHVMQDVKYISEYMRKADIAISSQGRTMFELASMQVPTILIAQNERELLHTFGSLENGFINLGLGKDLKAQTLKETLLWLYNSPQIRKQMKERMEKIDLKSGLKRVLNIITQS